MFTVRQLWMSISLFYLCLATVPGHSFYFTTHVLSVCHYSLPRDTAGAFVILLGVFHNDTYPFQQYLQGSRDSRVTILDFCLKNGRVFRKWISCIVNDIWWQVVLPGFYSNVSLVSELDMQATVALEMCGYLGIPLLTPILKRCLTCQDSFYLSQVSILLLWYNYIP